MLGPPTSTVLAAELRLSTPRGTSHASPGWSAPGEGSLTGSSDALQLAVRLWTSHFSSLGALVPPSNKCEDLPTYTTEPRTKTFDHRILPVFPETELVPRPL